ncbi:hypothetical protein BDW02DRAFT_603152 [Decorospora gaudefroyi]|uniref:Pyridoxamine 5'-phosphate oxidase putative domain-containing protein n=1 Tax=Decorospora gaudefroyi TaxID=184978 RepID=A0A6A5JW53_9PLEO|nr:hypothetical protein BDW02DRAFT_603152 [Decorospora gaudefroyi]
MGVFYETIPSSLVPWIHAQEMLFVGTAPLSATGHINISPKGGKQFGVLDEKTFWYMDLTGSGVETHAHLYEQGNGRIVVMFISLTGAPRILRIYGTGQVLENETEPYTAFITKHAIKTKPGSRSIIIINVNQCSTSCGFSVPLYDFVSHRMTLDDFFRKKEERYRKGELAESIDRYWAAKSSWSVDGLMGMKRGFEVGRREGIRPIAKMVGACAQRGNGGREGLWGREMVRVVMVLFLGMVLGGVVVAGILEPERLTVLGMPGLR